MSLLNNDIREDFVNHTNILKIIVLNMRTTLTMRVRTGGIMTNTYSFINKPTAREDLTRFIRELERIVTDSISRQMESKNSQNRN